MEHGTAALAQGLVTHGLIVAFVLVAAATAALSTVAYVGLRNRSRPVDAAAAVQAFRALDLAAFRNLTDSSEGAFLRDHLAPKQFREVKRQRAWAAFVYTREAGRAAAALATVAQAARRSSDATIAASGARVAENALRLRMQTARAGALLLAEVALPGLPIRSLPSFVEQYERTTETLFHLGRFSPGAPLKP
jgi:hypothetical protein